MSAGRPTIDGKPAGTSRRAQSCTVTLGEADIEYFRSMGDGNLSAGIRRVGAEHREAIEAAQPQP